MNINEIMALQKLATKAYDMINKYAPEDDEEDWESDNDDESDYDEDLNYDDE